MTHGLPLRMCFQFLIFGLQGQFHGADVSFKSLTVFFTARADVQ